jgi:hypothetical protein
LALLLSAAQQQKDTQQNQQQFAYQLAFIFTAQDLSPTLFMAHGAMYKFICWYFFFSRF